MIMFYGGKMRGVEGRLSQEIRNWFVIVNGWDNDTPTSNTLIYFKAIIIRRHEKKGNKLKQQQQQANNRNKQPILIRNEGISVFLQCIN